MTDTSRPQTDWSDPVAEPDATGNLSASEDSGTATPPIAPSPPAAPSSPIVLGAVSESVDDVRGHISPLSLLLVRPVLLIVAALVGGLIGFGVTHADRHQATAVLEFTTDTGIDDATVERTGQTLARQVPSAAVLEAVSVKLSIPVSQLEADLTVTWQDRSQLIDVVAEADSPEASVAIANAVATSYIEGVTASVQARLDAARAQSNDVLRQQRLTDDEAERSRQAQLGSAAGDRQDAILAQADAVTVMSPAVHTSAVGISRAIGGAVGIMVGLAIGALVALILGVRRLRIFSGRTVRQLLPGTEVCSASRTPEIVGQMVESELDCLAVVVTADGYDQGRGIADDAVELLRAHGRRVTLVDFAGAGGTPETIVGRTTRTAHLSATGTDTLVAVVSFGSAPARLLQGQSDIAAVVVIRRLHTSAAQMIDAVRSFRRSQPTVVLTR